MRDIPVILWVSDSPRTSTGLGRTSREILTRLAGTGLYRIISYACFDDMVDSDVFSMLPFEIVPGDKVYGRETLQHVLQEVKPDILITCGDVWMMDWIYTFPERGGCYWIIYCMPDGFGSAESWDRALLDADLVICCSQYGATMLGGPLPMQRVLCIPLGVNPDIFRPLEDRDALRLTAHVENHFVVGCVARNQFRKNLPALLTAFARFAHDKNDVVLYLHTDLQDPAGSDLLDLARRLGIDSKMGSTRGVSAKTPASDEFLCKVYNLFDVFALPTFGEGFGLPLLEAMACGVPTIATECSAVTEIVGGRGRLIKAKARILLGHANVEQTVADTDHLQAELQEVYSNADLRAECSMKGKAFGKALTWDFCSQEWQRVINRIVLSACRFSPQRKISSAYTDVTKNQMITQFLEMASLDEVLYQRKSGHPGK